ncbi:MAG: ABC transporter permease [Rubripirellula sp.]|nr:ABC transporter permease [Rubripirellula sp.]
MRPYAAVIRDSFHAALTSRVLWIAFVAIWLLLAALSPIGYREDFTTRFRGNDFNNGTRMKAMLAQGLADPEQEGSATANLANAMPEELRQQLRRVAEGDDVLIQVRVLASALNDMLDEESWYDAEAWKSTLRFKELRELDELADEELDESTRRRRARLRIEAALPGVFVTRSARSVLLTYAGMDFPADLAIDKTQFGSLINQFVFPLIIDWLLGFILLFLGILVTSSIIPDMLQPGSLHLLLSKPISRTLLLLSKFLGGCAFVLLCVTQLVIGLYLVAGLRLDVWNLRLLWCIPVSVFLFSVFFSVSVLAGLRWRSPILAIGVTTIFGTICFITGILGELSDGFIRNPDEIRGVAIAGKNVFASTEGGGLKRFNEEDNAWLAIFKSNAINADRVLNPIPLGDDMVATAVVRAGRFNPFGAGPPDLLVLSEAYDWESEPSLRLPTATSRLFLGGDSVLSMNTSDLATASVQNVLQVAGETEPEEESKTEEADEGWLSKLNNMMGGATSGFSPVLPPRMAISKPRDVAFDPAGKWIIAISSGRLTRLEPSTENPSQRWTLRAERLLEGEVSKQATIAVSGNQVLVARSESPLMIFDAISFEPVGEPLDLSDSLIPDEAQPLGNGGRFALLTSDGRCRIIEPKGESATYEVSQTLSQKEIEALYFHATNNELLIAHHIDQIDFLDANDFSVKRTIRPSLAEWRLIDKYVLTPLRIIVPQTGELGEPISALISGKSAIVVNAPNGEDRVIRYNIARPLLSCTIFLLVMMAVGCTYFATRDF